MEEGEARGEFRYARGPVLADYVRAATGLVLTAGPLLAIDTAPWAMAGLGAGALVFMLFALRTAQRHISRVSVDDEGVRVHGPLGGAVRWADLRMVRLSYYSTRRDRRDGWMHMTLKGGKGRKTGGTVRLESSLDGFDLIAGRAAEAARGKRLALEETTIRNFAALGIDADFGGETP